jgi:hypothetical protein
MHIFYLFLLLCVAQAFAPSYLADLPTRDANSNAELERSKDLSHIEQPTDYSRTDALSTDNSHQNEPTHGHSTAVGQDKSGGADNDVAPSEQEHTIARRDVGEYIALVKDGIDIKKYHDFLKTKVEDGSWMYQIGPDEKILGYGSVTLTQDAKTEVETHQDTFGMLEDLPITF